MSILNYRRDFLRASLAMCASVAVPSARACEFFTSTLRITHPWTRASAPGATSALLCMKIDQVIEADRLIGVETPVANGVELVIDGAVSRLNLPIPKGREINLGEAGVIVRLVDLNHPLLIARTYPLALVFEKSGKVDAELNVDYMDQAPPVRG
ncbi:copper chaperone PCu(A)C [Dechloromonas denitrificans]|uniref:copper chaperone PCu(A)C n=1 Tax=Dechloromonas denitrificans TaxID=281362 RepID=UPI001CF8F77E|nr:copper chaperone PCu(A)C [Dechloromonas denitrificans]UCV03244.1 copper chaperone PCu(A)C [Dechloromonas denitrificans]